MKTAHLQTETVHDSHEVEDIERIVWLTDGVKDVASVRSLHLISVLYDEHTSSVSKVLGSVRRAGYRVRPYRVRMH